MYRSIALIIALFAGLASTSIAQAVDMSTAFGGPKSKPVPVTQAMVCTASKTTIVANGIDSTTVTAKDLAGATITSADVVVTGNGTGTFSGVALPKTLTASAPGQWDFSITKAGYNSNCSFSIVAQ